METKKLKSIKESKTNKRKALIITLSTLIVSILIKRDTFAADVIQTTKIFEHSKANVAPINYVVSNISLNITGILTAIFTLIMIINKINGKKTTTSILVCFICSIISSSVKVFPFIPCSNKYPTSFLI